MTTRGGRFGGPRKARPGITSTRTRRQRRAPAFGRQNQRTGGFMGIEKKFADTETADDAFAVTWARMEGATNSQISGVAQGNGESQRIGRKIQIHSIHIKARVTRVALIASAVVPKHLVGRFVLVLDTQTNGAALTATDVMDGGQNDDTMAFRNMQFTSRFRVLWDKRWVLKGGIANVGNAATYSNGNNSTGIMVYNKRFKTPISVTYNSTTTAVVAAVTDNSFHIIGVANDTLALLSYQVRIRYTG